MIDDVGWTEVSRGLDILLPKVPTEVHDTYIDVLFEECRVCIERRPPYCNRGRWVVKVDQDDSAVLTVDSADGFPRYYFGTSACVTEVAAWAAVRKLTPRKGAVDA